MKKIVIIIIIVVVALVVVGISSWGFYNGQQQKKFGAELGDAIYNQEMLNNVTINNIENQPNIWQRLTNDRKELITKLKAINVTPKYQSYYSDVVLPYYETSVTDGAKEVETLVFLQKIKDQSYIDPGQSPENIKILTEEVSKFTDYDKKWLASIKLDGRYENETATAKMAFDKFVQDLYRNLDNAKNNREILISNNQLIDNFTTLENMIIESINTKVKEQKEIKDKVEQIQKTKFTLY